MLLGELSHRLYHPGERLRFVIGEVGDHRHHRARGVEEIGVVHARLLRGVVEYVLVAVDGEPLGVALEGARRDLPRRIDQRHRRLHTGDLL